MNPIERLEILRQVNNVDYKGLNIYKSLQKFYKTQGVPGFFKGNSAALVRIFPFSAVEFYSFEFYKNLFIRGRKDRQNSFIYTLLCGGLTGLNAITLTFPLDVARTRLAINTVNSPVKDTGIIQCIVSLYKSEGFRGLYKGYSVTFIGSIPFVALKQTSFDFLKNNFMIPQYRTPLNFIFGSISGVIGTTLLYPTHLIKRVFQANSKKIIIKIFIFICLDDKSLRIIPWVKNMVKTEGIKSLYRGMSITYIKIIPYQGLLFSTNEKLKIILGYEKLEGRTH